MSILSTEWKFLWSKSCGSLPTPLKRKQSDGKLENPWLFLVIKPTCTLKTIKFMPGNKLRQRRGEPENIIFRHGNHCIMSKEIRIWLRRAWGVNCYYTSTVSLLGSSLFPSQHWDMINILHTVQKQNVTYQKPYWTLQIQIPALPRENPAQLYIAHLQNIRAMKFHYLEQLAAPPNPWQRKLYLSFGTIVSEHVFSFCLHRRQQRMHWSFERAFCPSKFLEGKIHPADLGSRKIDPKTCSRKSSKFKNSSKSQGGCSMVNNVLKTRSSILLVSKLSHCIP